MKGAKESMKSIDDMEHCSIIEAVCPYVYGCRVCRLHNDYEEAVDKSHKLAESQKGTKDGHQHSGGILGGAV